MKTYMIWKVRRVRQRDQVQVHEAGCGCLRRTRELLAVIKAPDLTSLQIDSLYNRIVEGYLPSYVYTAKCAFDR